MLKTVIVFGSKQDCMTPIMHAPFDKSSIFYVINNYAAATENNVILLALCKVNKTATTKKCLFIETPRWPLQQDKISHRFND